MQSGKSENVHFRDITNLDDKKQEIFQVPSLKLISRHFRDFAPPRKAHKNMVVENDQVKRGIPLQLYPNDREWSITIDHCYARPWNWRPDNNFLRPTKTLFVRKQVIKRKSLVPKQESDDAIDVETDPVLPASVYDVEKSKQLMEECEKHASLAKVDDSHLDADWEENISKTHWTPTQNRLFTGTVNILNNDHMGRLAHCGVHNEAIMRRTVIDKSVERLRRLLATIAWDPKLLQWLHITLIDNLSKTYLAIYLDILQTLKSKVPTFVEKMLYGPGASNKLGVLSNENLFPLLKRPWDPVASSLHQDKPKKLPTNPVLLIVPSSNMVPKRIQKWLTLLSNLATVVTVPVNLGSAGYRLTMMNVLDQIYATTRAKIQELKNEYPGRNIVLVGFNSGATLALQIAQVDPVLCVICMGFSLLTVDGKRGDPEDSLLELQCPVLFVIGQCSNTASQEEMEELRERMRVETGLVVVGAADDYLRINKKKKRLEGTTQGVVDRCVVDEVGEFVSGIILSPYPPHIRQSPTHVTPESKKIKQERKRYNSNASSLDSEPPSPTPRITRPVGRPPGSKTKTKLDLGKWTNQGIPSSPTSSSSPPPPHAPATPDTSSNDSSLTDRPIEGGFIKKIKTLKPVIPPTTNNTNISNSNTPSASPEKAYTKPPTPNVSPAKNTANLPAKPHGFSYPGRIIVPPGAPMPNFPSGGGIKTIPPVHPKASPASSIKVLENVTLSPASTSKFMSGIGRSIDISKITVVNSVPAKTSGSLGNVLLLPDGKIKNVHAGNRGKYITSKKQLMGTKPPKPVKKLPFISHAPLPSLPPPTNLTTQDIMDLPIIFADDNQILEGNTLQSEATTSSMQPAIQSSQVVESSHSHATPRTSKAHIIQTTSTPVQSQTHTLHLHPQPSKIISSAGSKFVVLNKQITSQAGSNFIITPTSFRKVPPLSMRNTKYTKIILSKRDEPKSSVMAHITNLSPEISVRKIVSEKQQLMQVTQSAPPPDELIDLENEIVATAVPKPNLANSDVKNITVFNKTSPDTIKSQLLAKPPISPVVSDSSETPKRPATESKLPEEPEAKQIKLEAPQVKLETAGKLDMAQVKLETTQVKLENSQ